MSFEPLTITNDEWQAACAAAAQRVANQAVVAARGRRTVPATSPVPLEPLTARCQALRDYARAHYMPTREAEALLDAAWQARQREWKHTTASEPCAFDVQCLAPVCVTLIGVSAMTHETTHAVGDVATWRPWIEACMVLGQLETWLTAATDEREKRRQIVECASRIFVYTLKNHCYFF